jgi:hypothetical protein
MWREFLNFKMSSRRRIMAIVKKFQPKKIVGSKGENESFGDLFLPS